MSAVKSRSNRYGNTLYNDAEYQKLLDTELALTEKLASVTKQRMGRIEALICGKLGVHIDEYYKVNERIMLLSSVQMYKDNTDTMTIGLRVRHTTTNRKNERTIMSVPVLLISLPFSEMVDWCNDNMVRANINRSLVREVVHHGQ